MVTLLYRVIIATCINLEVMVLLDFFITKSYKV